MTEEDGCRVVLKVDMHCEACKSKVKKCLAVFPGVESIDMNMKENEVTIKGKLNPRRVYERVKRKSGRPTVLVFPTLSELDEEAKKEEEAKKKLEEQETTLVLKVKMHCEGCVREVTKSIKRMEGVDEVKVDMVEEKVNVRGRNLDPKRICDRVKRKTGKVVKYEVIPPPPPPPPPAEEEKKEEAKNEGAEPAPAKEEEKKEGEEEKKEEEKKEEGKVEEEKKEEEKKEEEKKEEEEKKVEEAKPEEGKKPEEGEDAKVLEEKELEEVIAMMETRKYEYVPFRSIQVSYPPQIFSDENPNACSIM